MIEKNIQNTTAPWNFSGEGYIMMFHFSKDFVEQHGFLFESLKGKFTGGFGLLLLADYKNSNVGPYRELMFIPGQFKIEEKEFYSMTKVFVSSKESLESSKLNWGITKEMADFQIDELDESTQKISLTNGSEEIVSFTLKSYSPNFPLSTSFIPNTSFSQVVENNIYTTEIVGRGKAKFASLKEFSVNPSLFIDTTGMKLWATIRVHDFNLQFNESVVEKLNA